MRAATHLILLSVFLCGVDSNLCITEELLGLKSIHGTTAGKEIFEEVSKCLTEMRLPWNELMGLLTDGVPAMWIGGQDSGEDAGGELCR